jgi:hypothetical protein
LAIGLPILFLAITYVLSAHIGHVSPYRTSKCQELSNNKKLFNSMSFDPCDHPLKIWEPIETLIPKMGAHLGVWRFIPSHCPTLPEHEM